MRFFSFYEKTATLLLLMFGVFSFNGTVTGQTFVSPGGDINIPDGANAPLCSAPGAYVCKNVAVSGLPGFAILQSASIVLIDDENVGSLEVEVRAPGGTPTFSPFSRTGSTSPSDCGDTTDAEGDYTFRDNALGNWWGTAAALTNTDIMPSGVYYPTFSGGGPTPPAGSPNNTMSVSFLGNTNGNWQVCIRDWGDNGGARLQLARLTFAIPTASTVSISGQVVTPQGNGIRNAVVSITGGSLTEPLITRTSSFGYYNFDGITAGGTYVITVSAKGYRFNNSTQVLNVQDNIFDANFTALE